MGGQGGQVPPQVLGYQLTLFRPRGADYVHYITTGPPPHLFGRWGVSALKFCDTYYTICKKSRKIVVSNVVLTAYNEKFAFCFVWWKFPLTMPL